MRTCSFRLLVAAAALILAASSTDALLAQNAPVLEQITERVAQAWEIESDLVRVQVAGGVPDQVDSISTTAAAPQRWLVTLYIGDRAVRRFVDVGHLSEVEVAAAPMRRGDAVDAAVVRKEVRVVSGPPGSEAPSVVGMVAERSITEGTVLAPPAVRPPFVVRGGDQVEAVLRRDGLVMTVRGEALGAAREGDVLDVRLASGVRRRARASGRGVVTLISGGD